MSKQYTNPKGLMNSVGYTHVVSVQSGKLLFVSGQVPVNEKGEIQGVGNFKVQVEQTFKNLKIALNGSGASFKDVIKLTIFVADYTPENLAVIRDVRGKYLNQENPPAITLAGVAALYHPDVKIEIELIAAVD